MSQRTSVIAGLTLLTTALIGTCPALAAHTRLENRNAGAFEVSPAMMHAIDVIVAEKMKMRRHRR